MLRVDKDLFAAAQAGDRAALERLLAQLRPDIQRYARFQCYASSSIEDVVQEALIVVYRRVGDIRSPAALGAWLVRVVARLCALPWLGRGTMGVALLVVAASTRTPLVAVFALLVALIAFRGCPMCWVFGLVERGAHVFAATTRKEVP